MIINETPVIITCCEPAGCISLPEKEQKYSTSPNARSLKELRDELLGQEIVEYRGGRYVFAQNYTFNFHIRATDFLLGGSNNG